MARINLLPWRAERRKQRQKEFGVMLAFAALAGTHRLLLVTKGDLLDQETKLARSGLGEYFDHVEIVSDKTPAAYRRILTRNGIEAGRFMMVGNSLRSDILPVVEIGGRAVYVPYEHTWMHENSVEANPEQPYHVLEHIGLLPDLATCPQCHLPERIWLRFSLPSGRLSCPHLAKSQPGEASLSLHRAVRDLFLSLTDAPCYEAASTAVQLQKKAPGVNLLLGLSRFLGMFIALHLEVPPAVRRARAAPAKGRNTRERERWA